MFLVSFGEIKKTIRMVPWCIHQQMETFLGKNPWESLPDTDFEVHEHHVLAFTIGDAQIFCKAGMQP